MGRARNRAKLFLHLRRRAYCARNACKFLSGEARVKSEPYAKLLRAGTCIPFLALTLFMALVLGADDHNFAVSLDYLALIAHRLYWRSNFHDFSLIFTKNLFAAQKSFSVRFFIVVKRLNGESKFRLAVFRRNFFEFELSFRAEGETRSREICILLDFSMRSLHSLSRNDREEKLSVFLYIMTSEYLPKPPYL